MRSLTYIGDLSGVEVVPHGPKLGLLLPVRFENGETKEVHEDLAEYLIETSPGDWKDAGEQGVQHDGANEHAVPGTVRRSRGRSERNLHE